MDNEPIQKPGIIQPPASEFTKEQIEAAKKKENDRIVAQQEKDLIAFKEKEKTGKSETVEVNKVALDAMIKRLERLEASADLSRLGKYDDKNKKEVVRVVMLSTWDGQVVIGWKMLMNDVQKINGIWRESQLVQLMLEDGTSAEIPYLRSVQEVVRVDADILSRTQESDGHETLKVRRKDDGKEYNIDSRFVN